jgi:hypothetical protein
VLIRPKAVSTLRASVRFAAALCEISGDFLIFARLHTVGVSFSGRAGPSPLRHLNRTRPRARFIFEAWRVYQITSNNSH